MFAVIKTGGKQYRVAAQDVITIEKLPAQAGESVSFNEVLMLVRDGATHLGAPTIAGAMVAGEVVEQTRSKKSISFVKRRRQNSRRKRGHRQDYTVVRITDILGAGEKPKKAAAKKKSTKAAAEDAAPASA